MGAGDIEPEDPTVKKVLVIDDDPNFSMVVEELLPTDEWHVFTALDGEVGFQMALEHRPDVVLCDLLMPRCNGFQFCRQIREHSHQLPHTRIIVATGSQFETDRSNALKAGADHCITKPIRGKDLISLLNEWTSDSHLNNAEAPPPGEINPDKTWLRFWGVRGSIPTPGPETVFYGGNTACVEVRTDGQLIILDAGTGIRPLGLALAEEFRDRALNATILISHSHWDHIQGFPFFVPAYDSKNSIDVLGYEGARSGLQTTLTAQMESPYFPINLKALPGNVTIKELKDLEFTVGNVRVTAFFLNHPDVCVGYRIHGSHGSIAFLADNETRCTDSTAQTETIKRSKPAYIDEFNAHEEARLIEAVRGVDVLIMDAQYDAEEYKTHQGWGHGSLPEVVDFAIRAQAKRLYLFHHDPNHDDDKISRMVATARSQAEQAQSSILIEAAREGLVCELVAKGA